ncbi:expressed unknown protein [Seminavis robusta]|uniref:PDZ domain-containing protein n=1 Tax=Seminavis robusta TaxID=568900 RepID=A0A9N8E445_9STRA|nr:expressed unknown protein [Seminavis robusta]|eukprot:Sro482_g151840.1 n/a (289) ;mRNA; f:38443-39309
MHRINKFKSAWGILPIDQRDTVLPSANTKDSKDCAQQQSVVTCTIIKETPDSKTGIALEQQGRNVCISHIIPGRLASGTALRPGMRLVSVNDMQCQGCRFQQVSQLLMDAVGTVTIVAAGTPVSNQVENNMLFEEKQDGMRIPSFVLRSCQPVSVTDSSTSNNKRRQRIQARSAARNKQVLCKRFGIRLASGCDNSDVMIVEILDRSPFLLGKKTSATNAEVKVGMTILSIQGTSCRGKSAVEVANQLDILSVGSKFLVVLGRSDGTIVRTVWGTAQKRNRTKNKHRR